MEEDLDWLEQQERAAGIEDEAHMIQSRTILSCAIFIFYHNKVPSHQAEQTKRPALTFDDCKESPISSEKKGKIFNSSRKQKFILPQILKDGRCLHPSVPIT